MQITLRPGSVADDPRLDAQYLRGTGNTVRSRVGGTAKGKGRGKGGRRVRKRKISDAEVGEPEHQPCQEPMQVQPEIEDGSPKPNEPIEPEELDTSFVAAASATAAAAEPPVQQLVVERPAEEPEPVDIEPRVKNEGHKRVVSTALPYLRRVMLLDSHCQKPPREQVRYCLSLVDQADKRFWGAYLTYTRKRTVEDLILQWYYDAVKALL